MEVNNSFGKIATKITIVDNTEWTIQVGGQTPKMVFLEIGAQQVIIGV
jgi:hypothetical protein